MKFISRYMVVTTNQLRYLKADYHHINICGLGHWAELNGVTSKNHICRLIGYLHWPFQLRLSTLHASFIQRWQLFVISTAWTKQQMTTICIWLALSWECSGIQSTLILVWLIRLFVEVMFFLQLTALSPTTWLSIDIGSLLVLACTAESGRRILFLSLA